MSKSLNCVFVKSSPSVDILWRVSKDKSVQFKNKDTFLFHLWNWNFICFLISRF
jgi:hypothetical protein